MRSIVKSKLFVGMALVSFGILIGYSYRPQTSDVPEIPQKEQKVSSKPYYSDVPANYFDTTSKSDLEEGILISDTRFTVSTAPKLTNIDPSTIGLVDRKLPFKVSLLKQTIKGKPLGAGWDDTYDLMGDGRKEFDIRVVEETDVNGDGEKEMVVRSAISYSHAPGIGYIITQEGRIIFSSESFPNFSIWAAKDGNGFYTAEKLTTVGLFGVGGFRRTRYLHQDGKFIPVWTQDEYDPIVRR